MHSPSELAVRHRRSPAQTLRSLAFLAALVFQLVGCDRRDSQPAPSVVAEQGPSPMPAPGLSATPAPSTTPLSSVSAAPSATAATAASVPRVRLEDVGVEGDYSSKRLREILEERLPAFEDCYRQTLTRSPDVAGRLDVRFQMSGGTAGSIRSGASTLADPELVKCSFRVVAQTIFIPKHFVGSVGLSAALVFELTSGT